MPDIVDGSDPTVVTEATPILVIGEIILSTGDLILIVSDINKYYSRINRGDRDPIEASKSRLDPSVVFKLTILGNNQIAIQADNGLYLSRIRRDGRDPIEAAKSSIDVFSVFTVIAHKYPFDLSKFVNRPEWGECSLKADNGLYLSRVNQADGTDPIEAAKSSIDVFSKFAFWPINLRTAR